MVDLLAGQPQQNGEPVFDAPWQARSFAMAVELHRSGLFSWSEWAELLAEKIQEQELHGPISSHADYYRAWQQALEQMLQQKLQDAGT